MKTCMRCGKEFATVSGVPTLCIMCLSPERDILARIDAAQSEEAAIMDAIRQEYIQILPTPVRHELDKTPQLETMKQWIKGGILVRKDGV